MKKNLTRMNNQHFYYLNLHRNQKLNFSRINITVQDRRENSLFFSSILQIYAL